MNRFGWFLLLVFILLAIGFGLMLKPGSEQPAPAPAPTAAATPVEASSGLIIPVAGVKPEQLTDTWGQSRGGGSREHHAIDSVSRPT